MAGKVGREKTYPPANVTLPPDLSLSRPEEKKKPIVQLPAAMYNFTKNQITTGINRRHEAAIYRTLHSKKIP